MTVMWTLPEFIAISYGGDTRVWLTDDPKEPKEDAIDDLTQQEPGELPEPVVGNDDENEPAPNPDTDAGEPDTEGEE